ncbi:citrate synthase, partial [Rhizobium ruizarguesonis]
MVFSFTTGMIGPSLIDVNLDAIDQCEVPMSWLTAEEALRALKTKPQTLYANVSRGRIRAKPDPADPRRSL